MTGRVLVGKVAGAYGVRGWIKIRSYTDPPENLLDYRPWYTSEEEGGDRLKPVETRIQGEVIVARIEGVDDRDQAIALRDRSIWVSRDLFPETSEGEYYWADLIDLQVETVEGVALGRVVGLMETGANDVIRVLGERERLIPFVMGRYIKSIDLPSRRMVVEWDPEF